MTIASAVGLYIFILIFSAAIYVLNSLPIYSIAKNRGIKKAGFAWVPVGNFWVIGRIVDTEQEKAGRKKIWAKLFLVLGLVSVVLIVAFVILVGIQTEAMAEYNNVANPSLTILYNIVFYALLIISGILEICQIICIYKLFYFVAGDIARIMICCYILIPLADTACLLYARYIDNKTYRS